VRREAKEKSNSRNVQSPNGEGSERSRIRGFEEEETAKSSLAEQSHFAASSREGMGKGRKDEVRRTKRKTELQTAVDNSELAEFGDLLLLGEEVVGVGGVDLGADGGGAVDDLGVLGVFARVHMELAGEDYQAQQVPQQEALVLEEVAGAGELVEVVGGAKDAPGDPLRLHEDVLRAFQAGVEENLQHLRQVRHVLAGLVGHVIDVVVRSGLYEIAVLIDDQKAHLQKLRLQHLLLQRPKLEVVGQPHLPEQRRRAGQHRLQRLQLLLEVTAHQLLGQEVAVQRVDGAEVEQARDVILHRDVIAVLGAGQEAELMQIADHVVQLHLEFLETLGGVEALPQELAGLVQRAGFGQQVDQHLIRNHGPAGELGGTGFDQLPELALGPVLPALAAS